MTIAKRITQAVVLAIGASAQVATFSGGSGYGLAVNVPADTANSGSGSIFLQISAPTSAQWVGFGQGNQMAGANMFVMYAQSGSNVTVSSRSGAGHVMPEFDSSAQVTVLEGTGISGNTMVANIRCDTCITWNGGSMNPTSSSSNWIFAYKEGSALDSSDTSATIQVHDNEETFNLDLTAGIGGNSVNPFVSSSSSGSSTSSGTGSNPTASPSATNGVSTPVTGGNQGSSSSSTVTKSGSPMRLAHGVIMSLLFLGLFPFFALTLYLPTNKKVRYVHAPLQILAVILLIIGMALGIVYGMQINELDNYHMIIGFAIVAVLVLFQPAMGLLQHLHYTRTGTRSSWGIAHRTTGRIAMIVGIINGGLGWNIAGNTNAYIPYAVVAALVFLIYVSVVAYSSWASSHKNDNVVEKTASPNSGYEMHMPRQSRHSRLPSDPKNNYVAQQQPAQQQPAQNAYRTY